MSYVRRTARVLLVDGSDRLLLMRFRFQPGTMPRPYGWLTPGGGVQDGETLAGAAARELGEEVGLDVAADDLGEPVAYTAGYAGLGWAVGDFRDEPHGRRGDVRTRGERWWSVGELATTDEIVYPYALVPLLTDLLGGRRPTEPVVMPWHHASDPMQTSAAN